MKSAFPIDPDIVFASLEKDCAAGVLTDTITGATVRFRLQASGFRLQASGFRQLGAY